MYFLDEMSQDEVGSILKAKKEHEKIHIRLSWEQTRKICYYAIVAMRGTKEIENAEDVFSLPWDDEVKKSKKKK